jgi:hypothetical protein
MLEKTQSFDMNGQNYQEIQKKVENILKNNLKYSIDTERIGTSLLRINYFDEISEKETQKNNRITLLEEPGKKVYIQINGQLTDVQTESIWEELGKDLDISSNIEPRELNSLTKEEIIDSLVEFIKLKGYTINREAAEGFLGNFQAKYERLPKHEELGPIGKSYIIMVNEDYLSKKINVPTKSEPISEDVNLPSDKTDQPLTSDSPASTKKSEESPIVRRICPSCGEKGSIREVIDKNVLILDYPRIYGKKNYCGQCAYEWRK